ncbi:MAG: Xaa-Pro peptidase family protein [Solirubrobacterales bacterium]
MSAEVGSTPADAEWRRRVSRAIGALGCEAVIATSFGSFRYLSGYWARSARMNPTRPGIVVWPVRGEPVILVGADQVQAPRRDSWIEDVRGYAEREHRPPREIVRALVETLGRLSLTSARIGVELEAMPVAFYEELWRGLPAAQLVACDRTLEGLRVAPGPDGLAAICAGTLAAEQGVARAFELARPGCSEKELADSIGVEIRRAGASDVPYVLLGAGEGTRGFMPPTDRVIADGDLVRVDLLAVKDGYFVDIGRMAVAGRPSPAQEQLYRLQLDLNREVLDSIRPGVTGAVVFERCRSVAERLGADLLDQPLIGIGHAIGVNPKDFPMLKAGEDTVLEEGMVLNIEPDTLGPEGEIVHVEEMILVGADGAEVLSAGHDWSALPRICGHGGESR